MTTAAPAACLQKIQCLKNLATIIHPSELLTWSGNNLSLLPLQFVYGSAVDGDELCYDDGMGLTMDLLPCHSEL